MSYAAIVIAAGLSSRMGEFKPLLDIGGTPALHLLLGTIRNAGIENTVVVTGYEHELIENKTKGDVPCVYNADYESGMFSTVLAGIRFVSMKWESSAALLFPVDVPLVSSDTIRGLMAAYEQARFPRYAVPVYEEKNGHPLLIPREYYAEILEYTGEGGLKGVRSRHDAEMLRYTVNDIGCVLDMDTPGDYEKILEYHRNDK